MRGFKRFLLLELLAILVQVSVMWPLARLTWDGFLTSFLLEPMFSPLQVAVAAGAGLWFAAENNRVGRASRSMALAILTCAVLAAVASSIAYRNSDWWPLLAFGSISLSILSAAMVRVPWRRQGLALAVVLLVLTYLVVVAAIP